MLKKLSPLLLTLILVGCQKESVTPSSANPDTPTAEINSPAEQSSGFNSNRLFQLTNLDKISIKTKGGELSLWVMDSESKRQEGMMFLVDKEVKDQEGMVFVFPSVQVKSDHGFWMKNTILALDIVYVDANMKVINVGKGEPHNESPVVPLGDYKYVIEVKQGLAGKFGLEKGAKVELPKGLPAN